MSQIVLSRSAGLDMFCFFFKSTPKPLFSATSVMEVGYIYIQ
jgi:hypothetical protein